MRPTSVITVVITAVTVMVMLSSASNAQTAAPAATTASPANAASSGQKMSGQKITAAAVWKPAPDFVKNAHAACDNAPQPPSIAECFIDQMGKAGAPAASVSFTRQLYKQNGGDVGIMEAFQPFDAIAMVWIVYPLRANDNAGILFLNSDPNFLDVDNLKNLDTQALEQDSAYEAWKKNFPKITLFPGDRTSGPRQVEFARAWPVPGAPAGSQRFLFFYPLLDGCHACARIGVANYWWDFDAQGKFMGTKLSNAGRVPPPARRSRPQPPAQTPNAQPGTAPAEPSTPQPK